MGKIWNISGRFYKLFKLLNSLQIGYRMSVSLSSVYQQTESLRQIEQKFDLAIKQEEKFDSIIQDIVLQASNLSMSESYRLLVLLSKNLTNNSSVARKYGALYIIKKLILTAYHHFYIFASIRALAWISNITKFQGKKTDYERAKLYMKQMSLKGNGDEVYQQRQCYKLFKLADQFIPWFAQNIPIHINAQFQYMSTFARAYQQIPQKRQIKSFEYFQQSDMSKFEQNFSNRKTHNRQLIKQLTDFIGLEVRTLIDQQKYKSQLLRDLVKTSDSYCIKIIVSELCSLIQDNKKLFYCLKLSENLMNVGEIEFIQLTKLYIVPALLSYILPYNFIQDKKLTKPQNSCSLSQQKCIIDCICIWNKITERVGLSTKFYTSALKHIQSQKGNTLNVQQKHLGEFLTNVIDMEAVNKDKRPNIIGADIQQQLIKVLANKGGGIRLSNQWRPQTSVINQLSQFKQSQVSSNKNSSNNSGGFGKILGFQQKKLTNSRSSKTPKKGIVVHSSPQQLLTFKNIDQSNNHIIQVNRSPFKQSIKSNNKQESSFMAFNESQMSKFSQYSMQKPNWGNVELKNNNNGQPIQPTQPTSPNLIRNSKNSVKNASESGSIVYFGRSQDFHSQNTGKSQSELSSFKRSKKQSIAEVKSQKSLKINNLNQQSVTTYRFDSSNISKNSMSNSDIRNYGKTGQQFPLTVPKPGFAFKRKQLNNRDRNDNGEVVTYQNVLSQSSKKESSLSKIIQNNYNPRQLRQSIQSGIEDLSGGKHNFNGSIHLSQGSDVYYKEQQVKYLNKNNKLRATNGLKITPQAQYFQQTKLKTPNARNLKQTKRRQIQQNKITQSPKKPKMSFSIDKKLHKDSQQKQSIKQQSASSNNILLSSNFKNNLLKNGKQAQKLGKKHTVIIDEYANDRLLDLQRQLGKAILQKNKKQQQLKKKQAECKVLKSRSVPFMDRKMETLKKQDQIIQMLQNQKQGQDISSKNNEIIKPVKNTNKITDYFLQNQPKGSYLPTNLPYERTLAKQILSTRCLLVTNENLQLGYNYSQVQNQIGLYLTLYKVFDNITVKINPNSLILQKQVNLNLQNQAAGYQLKIKRKIKGICQQNRQPTFEQIINRNPFSQYKYPEIYITLSNQPPDRVQYKLLIPCSVFNLVKPIQIDRNIIQQLKYEKVLKTQPLPISQQFLKNYKQKIDKYFTHNMALVGAWTLVGYTYPSYIFGQRQSQFFKFRVVSAKNIQFQFFNNPNSPLSQAIINLLTAKSK